jgi:hypothetical protein
LTTTSSQERTTKNKNTSEKDKIQAGKTGLTEQLT